MPLNLFVPQVTNPKSETSVKDLIVLILSSEFPLHLKQIHFLLGKKYGVQCSFQATFKSLSDLTEKGVVKKEDKAYSLDKNWINKLKMFLQELETNYQFAKGFPVLESGENISLEFSTISEVDRFILSKLEHYPTLEKKINSKIFLSHLWWPMFYSFKEYLQMKSISEKIELTMICNGNTAIDKWCAKYYLDMGFKVKIGAKHKRENDLILFQDYIIQIFYPSSIKKKIKETFKKYKRVEQIKITEFYSKIFEKQTNIQVLINRNLELSKQLRAQND